MNFDEIMKKINEFIKLKKDKENNVTFKNYIKNLEK